MGGTLSSGGTPKAGSKLGTPKSGRRQGSRGSQQRWAPEGVNTGQRSAPEGGAAAAAEADEGVLIRDEGRESALQTALPGSAPTPHAGVPSSSQARLHPVTLPLPLPLPLPYPYPYPYPTPTPNPNQEHQLPLFYALFPRRWLSEHKAVERALAINRRRLG